jgi:hypothetical protein
MWTLKKINQEAAARAAIAMQLWMRPFDFD